MPRNDFRFAFQLLCWEGAFAMAYETWIGPTYLSGMAGELGVGVTLLSLLAAVPSLGSACQLLSTWAIQRSPSMKEYTIRLAVLARGLWAIPLFLGWYWGIRSFRAGGCFPANRWFAITVAASCLSSVAASSSGASWMAWVKELVPGAFRGRFFGTRLRFTMGAVTLAHAIGYFIVGWRPAGLQVGYGLLLAGALLAATVSTCLLKRVPEASALAEGDSGPATGESPPVSVTTEMSLRAWLSSIREPWLNARFRNLMIFGAAFNGAIQLAGPFFPYYFTRELGIPMRTIALWTGLTNLGWFLASVSWGKRIDYWQRGDTSRLGKPFWVAAHLICLSPIFYVAASPGWVARIGPIDYLTNGMAWAGYTLLLTTLLLKACPRDRSAFYFSVNAAASGLGGALGTFLGGQLAVLLQPWGGFRALWWVAVATRLSVLWGMYRLLMPEDHPEPSGSSRPAGSIAAETPGVPEPA